MSDPAEVRGHPDADPAGGLEAAEPVGPHRVNLVALVVRVEAGGRAVVVATVLNMKGALKLRRKSRSHSTPAPTPPPHNNGLRPRFTLPP